MTRHGSHRWTDDPANDVVAALYAELSDELGTDGPAETFGHPPEGGLGHLIEDDHGMGTHNDHDYLGFDTHDHIDLSAEEMAMHVMTEVELEEGLDPELSPAVYSRLLE